MRMHKRILFSWIDINIHIVREDHTKHTQSIEETAQKNTLLMLIMPLSA